MFTAHLAGPVALKHVLVEAASLKKEEGALEKSPTAIDGHRHRPGTPRRNTQNANANSPLHEFETPPIRNPNSDPIPLGSRAKRAWGFFLWWGTSGYNTSGSDEMGILVVIKTYVLREKQCG